MLDVHFYLARENLERIEKGKLSEIEWKSETVLARAFDEVVDQAMLKIVTKYMTYNSQRAVTYARAFIRYRAEGVQPRPNHGSYEYASVERILRALPVLGASRERVVEPPFLFGAAPPTHRASGNQFSVKIG